MKNKREIKRNSGIYCQYKPFVRIKDATTGITLVALIVTIVILLILAGVSIASFVGDKGLLNETKDMKSNIEDLQNKTIDDLQQMANELSTSVGDALNPGNPTPQTPEKGEILIADKTEYIDENGDKAIIPGGFCVVDDSKENPEDKNTVKDGLVISDVAGDDLDNSKHGNQFVWIPVSDYSKFHLIEGYLGGNLQTYLSAAYDPSREAGDTIAAGSPGKPNGANSVAGTTESIAMYKSVKDNGGFYIARFEAGIAGTTASTIDNDTNKKTQDGTVKPISQKGVGVWNWIQWGGSYSDTASDGLPGNDNSDGAVKVARSMYPVSDTTHKVTSTLCYGVQWDAALNFIDSNYETGIATGYVKDSTGKGNYTGSIAITGSSTDYQQKHIYDMAGNVAEWTMEAYDTTDRVIRGGDFIDDGSNGPASNRNDGHPGSSDLSIGARVALYL